MRTWNWVLVSLLIGTLFTFQAIETGCQSSSATPTPITKEATKAADKSTSPAKADQQAPKAEPAQLSKDTSAKASAKPGAVPTNLPPSTLEYLAELKKTPADLAGLDDELKVPQEWIDGAKKEGKVAVLHTIDPPQAVTFFKPFQERYPSIKVDYSRGSDEQKVKAITAAESGRGYVDVIIGVSGHFFLIKEANLPVDLSSLPNWKLVPTDFKNDAGLWVGINRHFWAMAYNTNKVKESDLPKSWDDLLTNPIWRNGNLALGNRSQLWMLSLWRAKGEDWAKSYLSKMFTEVKPQLRSEGMNAMLDLLAAGEFYATVPSAEYRVHQNVLDGAPISYWTPEPVPSETFALTVLKTGEHVNAARILTNWILSKEGQVAQYMSDFGPPVHPDMQDPAYLPFAHLIKGKQTALRYPQDEEELQPQLLEFWEQLWLKSGGKAR